MSNNGCSCHAIQKIGEPYKICISCRVRETTKYTCKNCNVGIWSKDGDYEGMDGLCTSCHYRD